MTIYTKQNNTVDPLHASDLSAQGFNNIKQKTGNAVSGQVAGGPSGGLRNRAGNAAQGHSATGLDASTLTRSGFSISGHSATGTDQDFSIEKGAAISAGLSVYSPAPPKPPVGLFNLALGQGTMVQDPVWTAVWP